MPHEKINHPYSTFDPFEPGSTISIFPNAQQLVIEWERGQKVHAALYPLGWTTTGAAARIPLTADEIDLLIKTLKRAKRSAYAHGSAWAGEPPTDEATLAVISAEVGDSLDDGDVTDWTAPPTMHDREHFIPEEVQEFLNAPPETMQMDDPWAHDTDGAIRDRLVTTFGIETDGDRSLLPAEVMTLLMHRHYLTHDQASNFVYPPLVKMFGEYVPEPEVRTREDVVGS